MELGPYLHSIRQFIFFLNKYMTIYMSLQIWRLHLSEEEEGGPAAQHPPGWCFNPAAVILIKIISL